MTQGSVRRPRCYVSTGAGSFIPIECEVTLSNHQSADTFSARLALDDAADLIDLAPLPVEVAATAGDGFGTLFSGLADKVEADYAARILHLAGRDSTAMMTDAKTNEKWLNQQPADIISDLAGRAGLSVNFGGEQTDRAGLQYNADYNRISELDSFWNVVVRLARSIGCMAYVSGSTLNIVPVDSTDLGGGVYTINVGRDQASVINVKTFHDLNLARPITVNYKSWRHKQGEAIESEFTLQGSGAPVTHMLKGSNLTKAQQDAVCRARLIEIVSHERTVDIDTVGDASITYATTLLLAGTGTGADQSYIISDVHHRISFDGGYRMTIRGRNVDAARGTPEQTK